MAGWATGCKIDTVSYVSLGNFSKTYGVGEEANIANQIASLGFLEDAPGAPEPTGGVVGDWFWEYIECT
jgi:hypothetical protein